MRIDPRQLSVLLAVARAGSLTAAGQALSLSQPGISAAIAQLERSMGTRLLDRGRHGAVPTEAGKLLIRRAEAIEELIAKGQREVDLQIAGVVGPLVVAGTPGALMSIIPAALARLRAVHPNFELQVREANDGDLIGLLRDRKADLTLSTIGIEVPPDDIVERAISQDPFELVVAHNHPLKADVVSLEELNRLPWVLPAASGAFRRQILALFLTNAVTLPQNVVLCDSLASTKEIICQTDYMTILPHRVVAPEIDTGALRTIALRQWLVTRTLGVRYLREALLAPIAQAFLDVMPSLKT